MARFKCISTPDGSWTVWDEETKSPATLGSKELVGLKPIRAETVRNVLERIEDGKVNGRRSPSS